MDTLKLWPSLRKAALLGTARAGESLAAPDDAPQALRDALGQDREGALLSMLALATSQRRAGTIIPSPSPDELASAASTCDDDSRPTAPAAACARLRGLSDGTDLAGLREWLQLAREHGVTAPHAALPNLLRSGVRHKALRADILPVLGERGRWLASQQAPWKWASSSIDAGTGAGEAESVFRDGEGAGRADAFALLRSLDAPRAVQVLAELWKGEAVSKREQWVEMLRPELSPADEAFLESALDDRGDSVRKMAAQVLMGLPESDFVRRSFERARKYLGAAFRGEELILTTELPPAWDASWKRDGLDEKASQSAGGSGQRTFWLSQMVSFVPPALWEQLWQATPPQILAEALRHEAFLVEALALAATRASDARWMQALLSQRAVLEAASASVPYHYLLRRIDALARDAILARHIREATEPLDETRSVLHQLGQHSEPWSAELTLAVLAWLEALARAQEKQKVTGMTPQHKVPGFYAFHQATNFAALMHLETLLAAPLDWPKHILAVALTAREILRLTAQTRLQMRREFDSD